MQKVIIIESLIGKVLTDVRKCVSELKMYVSDTEYLLFEHYPECCEEVYIESVTGDLDDLVGTPILMAEEVSDIKAAALSEDHDSWTWTFYKFATIKGNVTIRWYGTSNGYYSERVNWSWNGKGVSEVANGQNQ